jgi:hypothetical protein
MTHRLAFNQLSVGRALSAAKALAALVLLGTYANPSFAQSIPDNASLNPYLGTWSCNRGDAQDGNHCTKVIPPENASLNYLGNSWECDRGYYQSGQSCAPVVVPDNASLNYLGHGWECNRGYYQTGQSCSAVMVPDNASLDYLGHGWQCSRGFVQSGTVCLELTLPAHAQLDLTGHAWVCDQGFKTAGRRCVAMTEQDVQRQEEQATEVAKFMQQYRHKLATGESCQQEDSTGANVCVTVTDASLKCNESVDDSEYDDCDATVSYSLNTDYKGNSSLDAEVDCSVDLAYSGPNTIAPSTESNSDTNTTALEADDEETDSIDIDFSFTALDEVTRAKITAVECDFDSVDLE